MEGWVDRLGQGEKVASASAVVLFGCMFLSWFNFGFETLNAWEALHFISPVLLLAIVASLGVAFMNATSRDLGDIPGGLLVLGLGSLSTLLILFRLLEPVSTPGFEGGSTSASVEAGAFLALIAAAGVAFGGYLATDTEALKKLKRLMPSGGGPGAARRPAAPPPPMPPPPPAPSAEGPALPPVTPPPPETKPVAAAPQPLPRIETMTPPPSDAEPATKPMAAPEDVTVFCESCRSPLRRTDRFCGRCGQQQTVAGSL